MLTYDDQDEKQGDPGIVVDLGAAIPVLDGKSSRDDLEW
jgi:hypothetical protein